MKERLTELDLLRFFACGAVVLFHLTDHTVWRPLTQYGYLGVNLFFMISGFVILWSADGRTAREFAISRFARLYPCFWMCLAITVGVIAIAGGTQLSWGVIAANASMIGGWLDQPYVSQVYWTLLVELKFYVLVGALLVLRQMRFVEYWLMLWLAACIADAVIGLPGAIRSLMIAPYAPLFIAGAVFYLARRDGWTRLRMAAIGVCAAILVPWSAHQAQGFTGSYSVTSAVIVAALFVLMAAIASGKIRIKPSAAIATLSAMTYPLYLIHSELGEWLSQYTGVLVAIGFVVAVSYFVDKLDRPVSRWVRGSLSNIGRSPVNAPGINTRTKQQAG